MVCVLLAFTFEKNMIRHKEVHRYTFENLDYAPIDGDIIRCMECDETFSRETHLKRHKETVHESRNTSKMIKCSSCGKEFSRKDSLTRHVKKNICKK